MQGFQSGAKGWGRDRDVETQDRVYDVNQEESDEDKVDRMEQEADV